MFKVNDKKLLATAVMAGSFLGAPLVLAQGSASLMEEVFVTAQKKAENVQDVPISMTAFSGNMISELGLQTADEIATQTPNLSVESSFNRVRPRFNLRGLGSNDFNSISNSPVGVYVDEVFLNSPLLQGFQLFDLERVEVLRGPQGTLWGKNTTAGAINFITSKPNENNEGMVSVTYGRFDQIDSELMVNGAFNDNLYGRISLQTLSRDGWVKNLYTGDKDEEYESYAARAQLLYNTDELEVILNLHAGDLDAGGKATHHRGLGPGGSSALGYVEVPVGRDEYANDQNGDDELETSGVTLSVNWEFMDGDMVLTSITAFDQHEREAFADPDGSPQDMVKQRIYSDADQMTQELRLTSFQSDSLEWTVGAYWLTEDMDSQYSADVFGIFGPGFNPAGFKFAVDNTTNQGTDNLAAFAHATWDVTDEWTVGGGIRWTQEEKDIDMLVGFFQSANPVEDNFWKPENALIGPIPVIVQQEDESWEEVTGELTIDYKPTYDTLFYGSVRKGFRGGGFNGGALFSQAEAATVDPETVMAYELGAKTSWMDGKLQFNSSVFYYDYTDMQVFALVNTGGGLPVQQLSNAGEATVQGVELELVVEPMDGLYIRTGLGFTDSEFDKYQSASGDFSGNQLPRSPEKTFNTLIRYSYMIEGFGELAAQTDFDYTDKMYYTPANDESLSNEDGYWRYNARLAWTSPDEDIEVAVWGKNLTDEEYLVTVGDLSDFGLHELYYGDPRTYGVTGTFRF